MIVDTQGEEIIDEDKIMARLGIVDNGPGNLNHPDDAFNDYDGWVGIEFRGSSSQLFDKKGFGLETREANGDDLDVSLLGFPEEEDWVLHGPYSDKSLIRNALLYDLAGKTMVWAPRVRMVELIINDDYRGVYLFTERVKRDNNRVDINKLDDDEISGNDLTGGYILKFDKTTGEDPNLEIGFLSNYTADTEFEQEIPIIYHYPKPEDIVAEQREYIVNWIHDFEDILMGDNWLDPEDGYASYLDLNSVADMFIFNEISRNVDGYRLSTYFAKQRDSDGGKLIMGPVWDFNLAYGNADYCAGSEIEGWGYDFSEYCPEDIYQMPRWWKRFTEDETLMSLVRQRYSTLRANELSDEAMMNRIDSFTTELGSAVDRNFNRWEVLGEYIWPNNFVGNTYEEEIDYLTDWSLDRLEWIDGSWLNPSGVDAFVGKNVNFDIIPNPTRPGNDLRLKLWLADPVGSQIRVTDALGRLVINSMVTNDLPSIPTNLPAGVYVVSLLDRSNHLLSSKKWLVQ
jgi:hypothetical protein